jgi:outer membrane protein
LQKNIDAVAEENGYTYVFNSDGGGSPLLLHAPKDGDISDLVLKKMGIAPGAATPIKSGPAAQAPAAAPAAGKTKVKSKKYAAPAATQRKSRSNSFGFFHAQKH